MVPEFAIPVHDLDAAGKPVSLPVRVAWMRGAFEETDVKPSEMDGRLDLRLSKSGGDVVIRGTLDAVVVVACSRCLEPAAVAVHEEIGALAVEALGVDRTGEKPRGGAPDDDGDRELDADLIRYDGETVVLDDLVRDALLLGIPMLPLCSESCPGIRPGPSQPMVETSGVDPRLQPLLNLRKSST